MYIDTYTYGHMAIYLYMFKNKQYYQHIVIVIE